MAYEVFARKWRPQVFEDVIGQEHVTQTLINALRTDRLAHAYLFSGARGVGKTSVARILAKAINCTEGTPGIPCNTCRSCLEISGGSSVDVQEIDGASNRGIDEIRDLRDTIKYMPSSSRFRIYIIDEVHMLTLPAFNALLKTLEEPPPHVKFIFATTEPHKVPVTILSRCQRFDFKRISLAKIVAHLDRMTRNEGIAITASGLSLIAREAEGSMRDAQSLLDQVIAYAGTTVTDEGIGEILGVVDRKLLFETTRAIIEGKPEPCIRIVDRIYHYGYDLKEFYRGLMDQFRNLLMCLVAPQGDLLDVTDSDLEEVRRQAETAGLEKIQRSLNLLIAREGDLRYSSQPRLLLETLLIKLCQLGEVLSFDELIAKIEALEKRLVSSPPLPEASPKAGPSMAEPQVQGRPEGGEALDWNGFMNAMNSRKGPMSNVLKSFSLLEATDKSIVLSKGGNAFSAGYFDDPEHLAKLEKDCKDYFKRRVKIQVVGRTPDNGSRQEDVPKTQSPTPVPAERNELPLPVQEVLDIFNGELKKEISVENGGSQAGKTQNDKEV